MKNIIMKNQVQLFTPVTMAKIGLLSAVAIVLMLFSIPLWFAPSFYKLDFSEIPVLIGGFALGPVAAVFIELVKILLNLLVNGTQTAGIGELSNFILGISLVVPASIIYQRKKNLSHAVIGMAVGTVFLCIIGGLLNMYVLLPAYSVAYGLPLEALIEMGSKVNGSINSLTSFVLLATTPFNLLKGAASSVITLLLYKHISPLLHKESFKRGKKA